MVAQSETLEAKELRRLRRIVHKEVTDKFQENIPNIASSLRVSEADLRKAIFQVIDEINSAPTAAHGEPAKPGES